MSEHDDSTEPVEYVTCGTCKGRGTHITVKDHVRGAGHVVPCSGCAGKGVRAVKRVDERARSGERVARFG